MTDRKHISIIQVAPYQRFLQGQFFSTEAATRGVLWKKVFLEISQNSQENTCARVSFLIKHLCLGPATLLKKRLWHRCFFVNFVKFLRIAFYRTPLDDCFYFYEYQFIKKFWYLLTRFSPNIPKLYPLKTSFLTFSGGIEMNHWTKFG